MQRESAIHCAFNKKTLNKELIFLLLDHGANVNALQEERNWKGSGSSKTALELALDTNDVDIIQKFLSMGADPNKMLISERYTMRYDGYETWRPIHTAV